MSQFNIFRKAILYLLFLDLTEILAQTTCNNGNGRVLYERLPNQQLQGFDDDVVRDTAPPFRVLEKCQDLCLRDRTASNNLVRTCTSFDFQPGSRIASFSGSAEYEESTCYLTREQAAPEGIGNLMLVPNSVHFTEVCLSSNRPERECPSRRYVFERHPRKKLKLPLSDIKELTAANRSDCEDKCLNEFSFVCRASNFDSALRTCSLSRFTRRTHPELLEDDPNSDYLENTCLNAERRCDGLAVFVKEENKRLGGPFEVDIFNNMTLEECQTMCLRAEKYFCRSVEFDDQTKQCILSEEDSISQKDDISISSSPTHHFYDLVCLDNQRGTDYPDNSVTSHLFSSGRRPDTAFQRYRNSRLGGEFHSEITGRSLSECLDECLRQTSFQCRSAVYSDRFRTCRLSRYNQRDGMRIIYDADYDYYENLMLNVAGSEGHDERPPQRPDMNTGTGSGDWRPPADNRYPNNRYPDDRVKPPGGSRYPDDRIQPPGGGRYPDDRIQPPGGRYPPDGNQYPPGSEDGRYPPGGDGGRYPPGVDGGRYPPGGDGGRYPPSGDGGRYPLGGDGGRYPPGGDGGRYPPGGDGGRYPPGSDGGRYPPGDRLQPPGRYPPPRERPPPFYPPDDRYPPSDKYPTFVGGRYPSSNGRYPLDETYPPSGYDRYPAKAPPLDYDAGAGDRYPSNEIDRDRDRDRYPSRERYPINNYDERYPSTDDRERYPNYGNRYPYRDRIPSDNKYYPGGDRYPPESDNNIPHDDSNRPYPSDDRAPYPYHDYLNRRYPPANSHTRYPPADEERYPPPTRGYPPGAGYIGREHPLRDFPDKRFRPSSYPQRYPPDAPPSAYPPQRYPRPDYPDLVTHNAARPEPDSERNYPPSPTIDSKYPPPPTSSNRFPVGNGRHPIEIYKYGNTDRFRGRPSDFYRGHPYYDEYEDRPYSPGRPDFTSYDREYDNGGGFGRRPIVGMSYPPYEPPYRPGIPDGYNNVGGGGGGGGGGGSGVSGGGSGGGGRPPSSPSRCDDFDNFKQVAARHKMRRQFIRRSLIVPSLVQCQRECAEARDFVCRSFNYRDTAVLSYEERESPNCELSDRDSRELDIHNPTLFDAGTYDFYERGQGRSDGECLDVSQTCNEEGMEFTLRTPEGFVGRIYTYGFYDRCFFRGNGGTVNVLRISGPQGYPECGTQRYGDTLTNIVVVQFSDNVQTGRDKRYNLTCIFRGPGEAVVTSGYIGAGSGSPIPIEYLPAENTLSSKVRLMILYQNRPTTTIAVGDPLTFRLEAQDGYNHVTDIFATNVVARDPYSGRSIQLIDRFGCPVDPYVFPELDKLRDGDTLEARFNAFKIPESNFLVFEATVRTCREGCQPAYCPGPSGRSEPSFGRRRRSLNETDIVEIVTNSTTELITNLDKNDTKLADTIDSNSPEEAEQVREMIEVFESREEIEHESYARKLIAPKEQVCMADNEYYGLISAVIMLMILLFSITLISGLAYRKYWIIISKNRSVDRSSPSSFSPSTMRTHERFSEIGHLNSNRSNQLRGNMSLFGSGLQKTFATGNLARMCQIPVNSLRKNGNTSQFDDPSEPIYTDPSLFERSRSLRSLTEGNENHDL